jgi:hypothetical protein
MVAPRPRSPLVNSTYQTIMKSILSILLFVSLLTRSAEGAPHRPDLSRLVVVGDSLLAGYRNGGLVDLYQQDGISADIARQARVSLAQPLIGWPGFPAVLELKSFGPPPVIGPVSGSSTGRVDLTVQAFNLAVPGHTLSDALRKRPDFPIDSMTDLILGLPGLLGGVSMSQVEFAEVLHPTTVIVWVGNNDALNAAIVGDPAALTSEASFAADFAELMNRLSATGATIVVANIPDVSVIPYIQPVPNVAALFGVPLNIFTAVLGVSSDDRLNLEGVAQAGAILMGAAAPPLTGNFVLTPSEIAAIQTRAAQFNNIIAAQAAAKGAIVVDTAGLLSRWKTSGASLPGRTLTTDLFGGIFSLDGIHPTSEGAALTANEFIRQMNLAGAGIPPVAWLNLVRANR